MFYNIVIPFSYLVVSGFVLLLSLSATLIVVNWKAPHWRWQIVSSVAAGAGLVVIAGFFMLRPGLSNVNTVAEAQQTLQNGRPTLIEFYSNYCIGCMAIEQQMDQLQTEIAATYDVLRVDIHTDFGRALRRELGFSYTPELILYDSSGVEVWRGHDMPTRSLLEPTKSPRTTEES